MNVQEELEVRGGCGQKVRREGCPHLERKHCQGLEECNSENVSRLYEAKTGVGRDGFHPKVPLGLDKRNKRRNRRSF